MSRLKKAPISLPESVSVQTEGRRVRVVGPKGEHILQLPEGFCVSLDEGKVHIEYEEHSSLSFARFGLHYALFFNAVVGVSEGFKKVLKLIGVGYRAILKEGMLELQLGFSQPVYIKIPDGVQVKVDQNVSIEVSGMDKQVVGQLSASIRAMRPPEPYKGKGIRYVDEFVRKKAGKSAKGMK